MSRLCSRESVGKDKRFSIEQNNRRILTIRRAEEIAGIRFEPFPVVHSTRAPAVGYRIQAGATPMFYVPDVVQIHARSKALRGIHLYIGDGATISRPMVRKKNRPISSSATPPSGNNLLGARGKAFVVWSLPTANRRLSKEMKVESESGLINGRTNTALQQKSLTMAWNSPYPDVPNSQFHSTHMLAQQLPVSIAERLDNARTS